MTTSRRQAAIESLKAEIARLVTENGDLKRENRHLKSTENGGDMRMCPQCGTSYPNAFVFWPGYLIPGELACSTCWNSAQISD